MVWEDVVIFPAVVAQTPALTIHSDPVTTEQYLLPVLKFLSAITNVIPWHTEEVTTYQHSGKYRAGCSLNLTPGQQNTAESLPLAKFREGEEEWICHQQSPTTGGWMFVSTAVALSLKLNYPCNFTRRIRMAEQIRAEKGDKFRLVKKRRNTGSNPIWLKILKASDGKAGVFFLNLQFPFSPLKIHEPFVLFRTGITLHLSLH